MQVSRRLLDVPASPIRKLVPFALEAKKQGVTVYHLNIGDPDIPTPEVMLDVLRNWKQNPISYGLSKGQPEFIEALISYYRKLGFKFLEQSRLQVTSGGSEAIAIAIFCVADPGDEIIVFEPFYANYNSYAVINGVRLVPVLTSSADGFHLPKSEVIEKYITPKTKAILYCSPNNPTGTVYTKDEIMRLADIARKYKLFLLSDEVYREFSYDGRRQYSLLNVMQDLPRQTVVLDSMSKRYSVCGLRLGVLISLNSEITEGALRIAQGRLSAGLVDQAVAKELTKVKSSYFKRVHDEYEKRRNVLYEGLRSIPGVTIPKPEGAFYTIVDLPVEQSEDFCKWLLTSFRDNNETVMLAPASGFYATEGKGKSEVRIAYVINQKDLRRCIELLKIALAKYENKIKIKDYV